MSVRIHHPNIDSVSSKLSEPQAHSDLSPSQRVERDSRKRKATLGSGSRSMTPPPNNSNSECNSERKPYLMVHVQVPGLKTPNQAHKKMKVNKGMTSPKNLAKPTQYQNLLMRGAKNTPSASNISASNSHSMKNNTK